MLPFYEFFYFSSSRNFAIDFEVKVWSKFINFDSNYIQ